ncbi:hypothetical protein P4C99_00900 [Pontiellaceae bacterium B1224]|nr:hypothetical protein [Pontiellaceae bacterium B1224]
MHKKPLAVTASLLGLLLLKVTADGTITEILPQGNELRLEIRTFAGGLYQLQCSTNLVSGTWVDIGEEFMSDAGYTNLTVSAEAGNCWFRVLEKPTSPNGMPVPPSEPPGVPAPIQESPLLTE